MVEAKTVADVVRMLEIDSSPQTLEVCYSMLSETKPETNIGKKLLAEVCYLLGGAYVGTDRSKALRYANEAIDLYEGLDIRTLEDAVPVLGNTRAFTKLPEYMHEGVVRRGFLQRLKSK